MGNLRRASKLSCDRLVAETRERRKPPTLSGGSGKTCISARKGHGLPACRQKHRIHAVMIATERVFLD